MTPGRTHKTSAKSFSIATSRWQITYISLDKNDNNVFTNGLRSPKVGFMNITLISINFIMLSKSDFQTFGRYKITKDYYLTPSQVLIVSCFIMYAGAQLICSLNCPCLLLCRAGSGSWEPGKTWNCL